MKTVRANWADTLLVCGKCSKKLGGGFGPKGRTPLAKALRRDFETAKGRKGTLGIVEVKCLGVCPKGAVTALNGRHPGAWVLVPKGAGMDDVAVELGLAGTSSATAPHSSTCSGIACGSLADQGDHVGNALRSI